MTKETRAEKLARKARKRDEVHREVNDAIAEARSGSGVVRKETQDRLNRAGYVLRPDAIPAGVIGT
jgi:FAD/FMN-containing dehydrogenase